MVQENAQEIRQITGFPQGGRNRLQGIAKRSVSKAARSPASQSGKTSRNGQSKAGAVSSKAAKPSAARKSNQKTVGPAVLAEGGKAPAFHLPRDGGHTISLAEFCGTKTRAVFLPPRLPPRRYARLHARGHRLHATRGSVCGGGNGRCRGVGRRPQGPGSVSEQAPAFGSSRLGRETRHAGGLCAWGEKSMYGRTFEGILRTTVLIGADGKVVKVWRHVKVDGHADDVLAAAQAA